MVEPHWLLGGQKSGFTYALSRGPHGLQAGQSQYSFVVKIMGSGAPRPGFILLANWASIPGLVSPVKQDKTSSYLKKYIQTLK